MISGEAVIYNSGSKGKCSFVGFLTQNSYSAASQALSQVLGSEYKGVIAEKLHFEQLLKYFSAV